MFALVIMSGAIGGCAEGPAVLQLQGGTMGTTWHVTVVDAPADITSAELQQITGAEPVDFVVSR